MGLDKMVNPMTLYDRDNKIKWDRKREEKKEQEKEQEILNEIKKNFSSSWGKIVKIHRIEEYSIVEAEDKEGETLYHPYYPNIQSGRPKPLCFVYLTLERAIIGVIAYAYNSDSPARADIATEFICKMLGIVSYSRPRIKEKKRK